MSTAKEALRIKRSHHLWSAEKDEAGKIKVNRSAAEKEEFNMEKTASRKNADKETSDALWGLFAASLCDDKSLTMDIPKSIVARFNASVSNEAPEVKSWEELRTAFGSAPVAEIRQAVAQGIKVRLASKYLNIPFIMAKEVMDVTAGVDAKFVKEICEGVLQGKTSSVVKKFGKDAVVVANIFENFKKSGMIKLAVDEKAKKIYEEYWGPFGRELCRETKKRIRADLAERWMRRNAIDSEAAAYWSKYFGSYGSSWISVIPKLLRPTK
jgi:hypothetical protein